MFYGWKLLAGLSVIFFLAIGLTFSGVGVVLPPMIAEFGWTRAQVGIGFAMIAAVYGLSGPMVAHIIGLIGCRNTIFIGGFINASGATITYFTSSLWQFYLGAGLVMGVGMAMQTVIPGNQLIANWFHHKRSMALGIFLGIGGLGSLSAVPASMYIDATGQWRHIWLAMAVCTLTASFIALLVVKEKPSDVGQFVDGMAEPSSDEQLIQAKPKVYRSTESWSRSEALATLSYWLIVLSGSAAVMGATIVTSQLVLHLTDVGIDPVLAGTALGLQGTIGAGARLFTGILGDKIDPRKLLILGLSGQLVGYYFLKNITGPLDVYLFVITFGMGYGMSAVSSASLVVNFFGVANNAKLMGIRGIVVTFVAGFGPISAGYLADTYGSYSMAFSAYMILASVAIIGVMLMRIPKLARRPILES
ncbi:MAG: MFS transporter [Gammaproteobacteria bacterium]|nr:MFS transporter [Gammaproteobacteria bacterium]